MKTKRIALTLLLSGGLIVGCNDRKLLDQVNPNQATVETFWKTEADALKGLNAAYGGMQEPLFSRWMLFLTDMSSDEGYSQSPWTDLANVSKFIVPDYNIEMNRASFQFAYRGLYRCHQVMENVPNITMNETLKKRIIAEAKVIRAYWYYNLGNIWGNVPFVLKSQTPNDRPEQATQQQVFDQVVKDCQEAAADLPESYSGADLGRFHKYTALALMGKTLMQQKKWAEAAAAFKQIIDQTPTRFDLMPNWADNFTTSAENNKESLMEIQYAEENRAGFPNYNVAGGSESSERAQFLGLRIVGWCDGQPTKWLQNQFLKEKDRDGLVDQRFEYTMFSNQSKGLMYGRTFAQWGFGPNDRFWKKYTNYWKNTDSYFSGINNRVIRLSDVYLLYAEALNEQGRTADAIPFANRVRARVNMTPLALTMTQAAFREQLRQERVLELAGETHRFFDMKRYGILGPELAGPDPSKPANEAEFDTDFKSFVKGKSELYPIPLYETDANPKIKQNPGW
jgi:tetratricopeptide (TPR) repeat protein